MKNTIQNFKTKNFYEASVDLFKKLSIPLDSITELSIDPNDIFETSKHFFDKIKDIYTLGMVSDSLFDGEKSEFNIKNKKDYEAVLIFAIELTEPKPTRSLLSDIARAFNREYHYTPVIVLFKYDDKLSLANTQRQNYKINKEGEKAGKVTILRDINITNPHTGHNKILNDMKISSKIKTYDELYKHWQEVFDVSILNKAFYKELQNWYFYAINKVVYPNEPKPTDPEFDNEKLKEYRAKNVIRLLTRLLFVWFIKEKGLVPSELFEEDEIKKLIKDFEPRKQAQDTLFGGHDKESRYYKAILQNLFFATLNQEMGQRAFRIDGRNQNTTNLMRYKKYFVNPDDFVKLVESVVPFMNGGLFECLDAPHPTKKGPQGGDVIVYEDGFSDRADNPLLVPDYIFFGHEDHVDLSVEYGSKNKAFKDASVKGLINILKSYKFTIAENTPIEEDVALDPELLGKVFENLLASYNPETQTTARKQTGSFYTPREIVSYMVDESLIAYLKIKLENEFEDKDELDKKLHQLLVYDDSNPFKNDQTLTKKIIDAIDEVKILDPAVGSGAFPMGALQKMVHLLTKLDPTNEYWQDLQLKKAQDETNDAFEVNDKNSIKEKVDEILESFNESINNPDYARKLYLIENTIFGVDIQPIAIQISKLRFFISLVVEQNINNDKENFGIRPLPNLESKFVAANTLIGLEIEQQNLFDRTDIKELETELQDIRHKIFNAKTPKTKRKYRELDKEVREKIKQALLDSGVGNNTAEQLSSWDPYDQNSSSPFFDMEWMYGIEDGFDIVIGNPPYVSYYSKSQNIAYQTRDIVQELKNKYTYIVNKKAKGRLNSMNFFIEKGLDVLRENGIEYLILDITLNEKASKDIRKYISENYTIEDMIFGISVFENVTSDQIIIGVRNKKAASNSTFDWKDNFFDSSRKINQNKITELTNYSFYFSKYGSLLNKIEKQPPISKFVDHTIGVQIGGKNLLYDNQPIKDLFYTSEKKDHCYSNIVSINKYGTPEEFEFINFDLDLGKKVNKEVRDANIALPNNIPFLEEDKIILRQSSSTFVATISKAGTTGEHKFFFFKLKDNSALGLKYILALINSKLLSFYALQKSIIKTGEKKQPQIRIKEFITLPIYETPRDLENIITNLVDQILDNKQNDEDTIELENLIDQKVYQLYGLTEDEIKIVEDSIK